MTAAAAALVSACATDEAPNPNPQGSLEDVTVPGDFTFQTNKPVALSVTASADAVQQGAALEIVRADGRRLYRGPIRANQPVALDVVIPSKDQQVQVRLLGRDATRTAAIDVSNGRGATRFE